MKSGALIYFEGARYNRSYDLPSLAKLMNSSKKNVKTLFHYLAKDKARYLVGDNAVIKCKHAGLMDDVGEVRDGTFLLAERISSRYPYKAKEVRKTLRNAWERYENFRKHCSADWHAYKDSGDRLVNMIMHVMPYIFCLTPQADASYQWRNYTDKTDRNVGGYCFSFAVDKLDSAIHERNNIAAGISSVRFLAPCFYKEVDDEKIKRLGDALIHDIALELMAPYSDENMTRILGAIFTVAPLIKARKFFREQEFRIILRLDRRSKVADRESSGLTLVGNPLIRLMSSIMLSPQGDKTGLRNHLLEVSPSLEGMVTESRVHESVVKNYITRTGAIDDGYENRVLAKLEKDNTASIISQEEYFANPQWETSGYV